MPFSSTITTCLIFIKLWKNLIIQFLISNRALLNIIFIQNQNCEKFITYVMMQFKSGLKGKDSYLTKWSPPFYIKLVKKCYTLFNFVTRLKWYSCCYSRVVRKTRTFYIIFTKLVYTLKILKNVELGWTLRKEPLQKLCS